MCHRVSDVKTVVALCYLSKVAPERRFVLETVRRFARISTQINADSEKDQRKSALESVEISGLLLLVKGERTF